MNGQSGRNDEFERRLHEAVSWHLRLGSEEGDEAAFQEFTAWLESDPQNRTAYDGIEDFDVRLENAITQEQRPRPLVPLVRRSAGENPWSLIRAAVIGGLGTAAVVVVVSMIWTNPPLPPRYSTGVGQSRTLRLSDGSTVEMNTATALSLQFSSNERRVVLDHGEAIFHVRRERSLPFIVQAGDREVRDLGTVFDVLRDTGAVVVAVVEGRVAISSAADEKSLTLGAGERLKHYEGTKFSELDRIDARWITAWKSGYLIYRNAPLKNVVADLNRYFLTPIIVEGAAASDERFSGVLRVRDESKALRELTAFLPLVAVRDQKGSIRLRAARAKP